MGDLVFVGLGLGSEKGISLLGLETAKTAETVFAELYTNIMPPLNLPRLERLLEKRVQLVARHDLEEDDGKRILEATKRGDVALLVPGDPLIATTHVDLRIRAEKQGITTRVVHGASIVSAVMGLSGLQNYKFGRSVTLPFTDAGSFIETPYNVIAENRKTGLHTLCFLDIRAEEKRYMTTKDALEALSNIEAKKQQHIVTSQTLVVGISQAGSENPTVKADYVEQLKRFRFGEPPHSLVFPGSLHFMEAEALITLAGAPEKIRKLTK